MTKELKPSRFRRKLIGLATAVGLLYPTGSIVKKNLHINPIADIVSPPMERQITKPNAKAIENYDLGALISGISSMNDDTSLENLLRNSDTKYTINYISGQYNTAFRSATEKDVSIIKATKNNLVHSGYYDMLMEEAKKAGQDGNRVLAHASVENSYADPTAVGAGASFNSAGRGLMQVSIDTYNTLDRMINGDIYQYEHNMPSKEWENLKNMHLVDLISLNNEKAKKMGYDFSFMFKRYGLSESEFYGVRLPLAVMADKAFKGVPTSSKGPLEVLYNPKENIQVGMLNMLYNELRLYEVQREEQIKLYGDFKLSRNMTTPDMLAASYLIGINGTTTLEKSIIESMGKSFNVKDANKLFLSKIEGEGSQYAGKVIRKQNYLDELGRHLQAYRASK